MTLQETRQLGIEFERRVQTMIPETEFSRKLDTETIYSFLNQYQDKYIHEIYSRLDRIQSPSNVSARVEAIMQGLLTSAELEKIDAEDATGAILYQMPDNFGLYVNSISKVSKTFQLKQKTNGAGSIPNVLLSQTEFDKFIQTPYDSLRIMRRPVALLAEYKTDKPVLKVLYDKYTTCEGVSLSYYKVPDYMNVLTSTPCELPMDTFDDLVTGAVELYVQYVAGAESKRRQQQEAAQKRAMEDQRDSRRSGGNQDEQS